MCLCSSTLHLVLCLFTSSKMKLLIEVKPQLFLQGRRMEWGAAFSDCWFFQKHFASSTPNMSPGLEFRGEDWVVHLSLPSRLGGLVFVPIPHILPPYMRYLMHGMLCGFCVIKIHIT